MHKIEIFHYFNEISFFICAALFLFVASEFGYFYGKYVAKSGKPDCSSQTENIGAALLGLLALLLGFAFAMSMGRFNERKALFNHELNEIRSCHLLADFLPNGYNHNAKSLLAEYTKSRADYYEKGTTEVQTHKKLAESVALQGKLWSLTIDAVNGGADFKHVAEFSKSLITIFNAQESRTTARNDHVPEAIIWLLIVVATISISLKAYAFGLKGAHLAMPMLCFILAISSVLTIVLDLDRPIRGIIQIDQTPMLELYHNIKSDSN